MKEKPIKKPINPKKEDFEKIDKLLTQIPKKHQKTIDFHVINFFQKNEYNKISKKELKDALVQEYNSNPEKFEKSDKTVFDNKSSFINDFNKILKCDLFDIFNQNKVKYVKINPDKTYEFLNSIHKQISLQNEKNVSVPKKKKKNNDKDNDEHLNKNTLLNKKTKRKNFEKEKNSKDKKKGQKEENKKVEKEKEKENKEKSKKQESPKKEKEEITTSEKIYNNFSFYQSNFSKLTFNDQILSNNSAPFSSFSDYFNSNNIDIIDNPISQKDSKEELLYISKDEEEAFKILSSQIKPLEQKLSEINSFISYKQKKLELVSNLLVDMNENLENYKNTKNEFNEDLHDIKVCFKGIDDQFKIFKNAESVGQIPFKNEIYNTHIKFAKKILKKSKNFVDNNNIKTNELNNYDIAFTSSKIIVENHLKEIIGGYGDNEKNNDFIENLKSVLRLNFDDAFKKLNLDNNSSNNNLDKGDNYNDMVNIFEKNNKLKNDFDTYAEKVKYYEKKEVKE